MKHSLVLVGALFGALSMVCATANAEEENCAISYTRTACPGKEVHSYAKCDGQKSCIKTMTAASTTECQALAVKACANDRLTITKRKTIKATYEGKPLMSATGQTDFCLDYPNRKTEFDHCG